jgi:hypothetical protein
VRSRWVLRLGMSALLVFAAWASGQDNGAGEPSATGAWGSAGGVRQAPWDDYRPYRGGLAREWRELAAPGNLKTRRSPRSGWSSLG